MNTRATGLANGGSYRNDDDRRRDEARSATLQSQVDELRQALRELASRQVRQEEAVKTAEGGNAQNRLLLDQVRQEFQQSAQARALDENRTRQYLGELEQRIDDSLRPIRSLQAHVAELLEASRRKTDDSAINQQRHEETHGQIEQLEAVSDRNIVLNSQLRDTVDSLKSDQEVLRRDILRNEDAVKIVDQEGRRKGAEMAQLQQEIGTRLDDLRSDIAHNGDLVDDLKRSIAHVNPTLTELNTADTDIRQELARLVEQSTQRFDNLVGRLDDQRQANDAQVAEARQAAETRFERLSERMDEVFELHREMANRIAGLAHHLDELRLTDESIRRDIWQLHEQRVRLRLEQAQQELEQVTGQRRQSTPATTMQVTEQPGTRPADR